MQIKSLLIIIITFIFSACIEKYNPQFSDYENLLVVEGMVSNEPGPYIVKLSFSTSVSNPEKRSISGAIVTISDNEGNSEILLENSPGEYKTSETGIQGIIGRSYKVRIQTGDNVTYESEFQELLEPPNIESVYYEREFRLNKETKKMEEGYQFYISSEINSPGILWRPVETYEYTADFKIYEIYRNYQFEPFPNPDTLFLCWKTANIFKVYTFKRENIDKKEQISEYPLHFVSAETRKLEIRYSLLLKEYSIGSEEADYWAQLQEMDMQGGMFATKQPYQVRGNVKRINDEEFPVLGYFTVSGVNKKRIFVNCLYPKFYFSTCGLSAAAYARLKRFGSPGTYYISETIGGGKGVVYLNSACVNCTKNGGDTVKPDFW